SVYVSQSGEWQRDGRGWWSWPERPCPRRSLGSSGPEASSGTEGCPVEDLRAHGALLEIGPVGVGAHGDPWTMRPEPRTAQRYGNRAARRLCVMSLQRHDPSHGPAPVGGPSPHLLAAVEPRGRRASLSIIVPAKNESASLPQLV